MLLTHAQMVRALKGKPIHLAPSQFTEQQNTPYGLVLGLDNLSALKKARKNQRGVRIRLNEEEMKESRMWAEEVAGKGLSGGEIDWKKIGRQLKRGAKEAVPIVKSAIKTTLKKAYEKGDLEKGLTNASTLGYAGLATYLGRPDLVPYAYIPGSFTGKVLTETGHRLGAYGIKKSEDNVTMEQDKPRRRYPITTKPVRGLTPKKGQRKTVVIALPSAHVTTQGEGIKSDLKKLGKKLHKVAKPLIKKLAHQGVKELVKIADPIIPDKYEKDVEKYGNIGVDALAKKIGAYGLSRGGHGLYRGEAKGLYRGRGEGMRRGGSGFAR
jgi:hypothetical protein